MGLNKEIVAKKYENKEVAESYLKKRYKNSFFKLEHEVQLKIINKYIKDNFIEIAPGVGRISKEIKEEIKNGMLVEYSNSMIKKLKGLNRFKIIHNDFFKFNSSKKFDFCFCFRFIRHFDLEERTIIYKKISSFLKKDSFFVLDIVNKLWGNPIQRINKTFNKDLVYDKYYSLKEIKEELNKFGFRVYRIEPIYKIYPIQRILYYPIKVFNKNIAESIIKYLDKILGNQSWGAWEWIIVAQKK